MTRRGVLGRKIRRGEGKKRRDERGKRKRKGKERRRKYKITE